MRENKKNIILVDFDCPDNWELKKEIEKITGNTWEIRKCISNMNHGSKIQNLIRYIKYFSIPFNVFLNVRQYKSILAWQQFYGLILAFYLRLFHIKKYPNIIVMTFIYNKKKAIVGDIYHRFINYIVTSEYIKAIMVYSESEREYYAKMFNVSKEKFTPIKLGVEDTIGTVPRADNDNYYLSVGRSNRDYDFLIQNWKNKKEKIKIICDTLKVGSSENIEILSNCYGYEYLKILSKAKAVIIPLKNNKISSGQLVLIQAMMYGKPIIITNNSTVEEYICNGVDGLIIDKTNYALEMALEKLNDQMFYNYISKNARKKYEDNFSIKSLGNRLGHWLKKQNY